jgi:ribosomal protein L5
MKNPIIQKARKEAYELGYKKGMEMGVKVGMQQMADFFAKKFDEIGKVNGIGPKTLEKFVNAFGPEYFVKVDE